VTLRKTFAAPCLELLLQVPPGGMGGGDADQGIEAALGLGGGGGQGTVLQAGSSLADADGPAQVVADLGRDDGVAAGEGVLHIAQNVGETDLMGPAQLLLPGVAVRDPDLGLVVAQHLRRHAPRPAGRDVVQHGPVQNVVAIQSVSSG
jgi:hypothetical protein